MKKSEELNRQAEEEDNDFKYLSLRNKALREHRLEKFDNYIPKLEALDMVVVPFNGQKIIIDTQLPEWGILDYFPKANKILIRKTNTWIPQGLKWMINIFKILPN